MKQHKWHKEIKAWADGVEIEWRWAMLIDGKYDNWRPFCKENKLSFFEEGIEYRIKPQPVEPKYLYCFVQTGDDMVRQSLSMLPRYKNEILIGKIPLIVESNDE